MSEVTDPISSRLAVMRRRSYIYKYPMMRLPSLAGARAELICSISDFKGAVAELEGGIGVSV